MTSPTQFEPAPPPASPQPQPRPISPPSKAKPPKLGTTRETIESIVVAFVLAFLFRTFEAEAFVIPTGSMAPTLHGQHRDVTCKKCGVRYALGASEDVRDGFIDRRDRAAASICPNCSFPNPVLTEEIFKGDRILVNKFPYELHAPERWDVIVFKFPDEAKTNYIKRLIGLPGEELKIEWGDIFTRQRDSKAEFLIARKAPAKQWALQQLVYDDNHPPRELLAAGWPERWQADAGASWRHDAGARQFRLTAEKGDAAAHWLRYRHYVPRSADWEQVLAGQAIDHAPRPLLITDFYPYNAKITAADEEGHPNHLVEPRADTFGVQWVGDLTLSCEVQVHAAAGELSLELVEGARRYRCRFDLATGQLSLFYLSDQLNREGEETVPLEVAPETSRLKGPGTYRVSFANVDDRLCVWVDDQLVRSVEMDPGSRYAPSIPPIAPTARDLAPAGVMAVGGDVSIGHLKVHRDLYYRFAAPNMQDEYETTFDVEQLRDLLSDPERWFEYYRRHRNLGHPYYLRNSADDSEDEFFMLGDNSPRSRDSRLWSSSPAVPRRLLIGKAFLIYWPHGIPFLNDGKGYTVSYYNELKWDAKQQRNVPVRAKPPAPAFSLPFYPQIGRMNRIR